MALSSQLGTERLNTFAKELLLSHYKDLEFADDVTNLKCVRCEKVLIYNFKTNCGHHLCKTCKPVVLNRFKCPECGTLITNTDENDITVEKKINHLRVFCLNKKYGCKEIVSISELLLHLNHCENTRESCLPVEYKGPRDVSVLMDKFGELTNQVTQIHKQLLKLTFQVNQNKEQIKNLLKEYNDLLKEYNDLLKEYNDFKEEKQNTNFNNWKNNSEEKIHLKTIKNVVLLGESGSGKSTLINAFDSFYSHQSFEEVLAKKTPFRIPTKIMFTDDNYEEINIQGGKIEPNECMDLNESSTRRCKSYLIPVSDECGIRFIDSPGFASTWGYKYDRESVNDIVEHIGQYEELHAIAIVVKGNQSTLTTKFQYWFQQILTMLPKSVCSNVIFIFSNGNKPQGSLPALKKVLNIVKEKYTVMKSLELSNIFAFQNEGLITVAAKHQNIEISDSDLNVSKTNWDTSKVQAEKLKTWLYNCSSAIKSEDITNLNDVRLLLSHVNKINKQYVNKIKVKEIDQKEGQLLDEASRRARNFIVNNAILCTNFKKHDYKLDFNISSGVDNKKSIKATNSTSMFMDILNSKNEIKCTSENYWPQFPSLKNKLVTDSIHSSQFSYLFLSRLRKSFKN